LGAVEAQVRHAGYCTRPVRLTGRTLTVDETSGEVQRVFDTRDQPDGMLLKACGSRRASVCAPCSEVYRADSWHLVAAGLRGGKGVPGSVDRHPRLFVTLTAPSFGAVHSRREIAGIPQACASHRGRCPHGRRRGCWRHHGDTDHQLGRPLCGDCFDYSGAVLWNASVGELWRRTTIAIQRQLARLAGVPVRDIRGLVRLSFTRVVEYQARGLVHVHAVLRLDAAAPLTDPEAVLAPPGPFSAELLADAVRVAVPKTVAPAPTASPDVDTTVAWGDQLDVRVIAATDGAHEASGVAGYIAKYATKSSDAHGQLDHRLHDIRQLADLDVDDHLRRLVTTAWYLGGLVHLSHLGLRRWAHTLGFRGHWASRSRRYSTTLKALRGARRAWHHRHEAKSTTPPIGVGD
jgi:hypothetical protein